MFTHSHAGSRVVAVLATRNEERFIAGCLENLLRQGVHVYLCDNQSTDRTLDIAGRYRGAGLIGMETIPYEGVFCWEGLLRRKEELFRSLDADWLMHVDADEIHLPPPGHSSLASAFVAVAAAGCNAVEFSEFTFIPTREAPDHDRADFQDTLRTYYPFRAGARHCVRAFRKHDGPMEIAWSGGHSVRLARKSKLYPVPFRMKHYQFLSLTHAARKYVDRQYRPEEVTGFHWHGWRASLQAAHIRLPSAVELRVTVTDEDLDASRPWKTHWLEGCARA